MLRALTTDLTPLSRALFTAAGTVSAAAPAKSQSAATGGQIKVTQLRSIHGQLANIAASVRGLGLRRRHQSVLVADTRENRGMIYIARHLLIVEQV
jgi:large subunit ribosomal protein L30